jgi:hypothetical protein
MAMVVPVPMRVPIVASRVVSPVIVAVRSVIAARVVASIIVSVMMVTVVAPTHHDRCGSEDDGRRDAEPDVDLDPGLSRLRGHKQGKSQEREYTPPA